MLDHPKILAVVISVSSLASHGNCETPSWHDKVFSFQRVIHVGNGIEANPPSKMLARRFSQALVREYSRYPEDFMRKLSIKTIYLCSNLTVRGQPVGGCVHDGIMCFDVNGLLNTHADYTRRLVHHELFHVIDRGDQSRFPDGEWRRLNPPEFAYKALGSYTNLRYGIRRETRGFLTDYSTTSSEEDMADFFAYMICDRKLIDKIAQNDKWIYEKAGFIVRRTELLSNKIWNYDTGIMLTKARVER